MTDDDILDSDAYPTGGAGVIAQGPLKNRQHEAFCVLISSGQSMKEAFGIVFGYVGTASDINEVLNMPGVNQRIASIAHQYNSAMHMTLVGHLEMLAQIRDSALQIQEVGVAYQCERARGEVAGLYESASYNAARRIRINFKQPKTPRAQALAAPDVAPVSAPAVPEVQVVFG